MQFERLIEKCTRAIRERRPANAMELRDEMVLVDFLRRIDAGERPSDLVPPPFENEHEAQNRQLREEIARKDAIIADLQNRLNLADQESERMRESLNGKIREKNQVKRLRVFKELYLFSSNNILIIIF